MNALPIDVAEAMLAWACGQNPGPWILHSKEVARAASEIASHCGMDEKCAYTLGLVHDIGRYKGPSDMMHILDGYHLMIQAGYGQAAQICLTHSFPRQEIKEYSGKDDCMPEDRQLIEEVLAASIYTDYDRLIQLCDSLALPHGICLMEKRLVDVALRHGTNDCMILKWKKLFELFDLFQEKVNTPLYTLFPEAVDNTFNSQTR